MKALLKFIFRSILPYLLLTGLLIWGWYYFISPVNLGNFFKSKPLIIDETPLLITEIKSIAELQTAKLYCEVVVDSMELSPAQRAAKNLSSSFGLVGTVFRLLGSSKSLVLVAKGEVIAGLNLQELNPQAIRTKDDSVWLQLPKAGILDVITNPSDFEIFQEEGVWSQAAVLKVKQKARQEMLDEAQRRNLVKQAEDKAIRMMKAFLKTAGFNFIEIKI